MIWHPAGITLPLHPLYLQVLNFQLNIHYLLHIQVFLILTALIVISINHLIYTQHITHQRKVSLTLTAMVYYYCSYCCFIHKTEWNTMKLKLWSQSLLHFSSYWERHRYRNDKYIGQQDNFSKNTIVYFLLKEVWNTHY